MFSWESFPWSFIGIYTINQNLLTDNILLINYCCKWDTLWGIKGYYEELISSQCLLSTFIDISRQNYKICILHVSGNSRQNKVINICIYNHGQKQLRHSSKKTCFVKRVSFSISNFHFSTPSPLFNVVTTWQCQRSVFQHWKGGERVKLSCTTNY